tara:strand:- start:826 stop:1185 length:360 start_codon:yes stop_codon:yes gene_type:complete
MAAEIMVMDFGMSVDGVLGWAKNQPQTWRPDYDVFWWSQTCLIEPEFPGAPPEGRGVTSITLYPTRILDPHAPVARVEYFQDAALTERALTALKGLGYPVYAADPKMGTRAVEGANPFI